MLAMGHRVWLKGLSDGDGKGLMSISDPIVRELDKLARLLENNGYAVEVDYTGATITVWAEVWPLEIRLPGYLSGLRHLLPEDEGKD